MRKLLFSVTSSDMEWDFFRSGGKGGQNQNKRDTGARCRHLPSGAVGEARDERSQAQNRRAAFNRCVKSKKFQDWVRIEAARRMGAEARIKTNVEKAMEPRHIVAEVQIDGKWVREDKG